MALLSPTEANLAAERLVAVLPEVRAAIRRHDDSCWAEHLPVVTLRFHVNQQVFRGHLRPLPEVVDPLICYAVARDALECLRPLHDLGCSFLHVTRPNGGSLLHVAARYGALRTLDWLVQVQDLAVDTPSRGGLTPLHIACNEGNIEIVIALLFAHQAFIDAPDTIGNTPLHTALHRGQHEIARVLIEYGANLGATSKYGATPLTIATQHGLKTSEWRSVSLLLDHGAALTHALPALVGCPVEYIARHPRVQTARLAGCDQHRIGRIFGKASPEQARTLLNRGAHAGTAVNYALQNSQHDLLAAIRAHRPLQYTSAHYRSALDCAHGLEQLLNEGGDPNAIVEHAYRDERLPLIYWAARDGKPETLLVLLQRGARSTAPPELSPKPLLLELVEHDRATPEVLAKYVECGHDINVCLADGTTAIHVLAIKKWNVRAPDTLNALLRVGCSIDARDVHGRTPLMRCVRGQWGGGDWGITALVEAGASITATDEKGFGVLHRLFDSLALATTPPDYLRVVQMLISHGADIDRRCLEGRYPEELGDKVDFPDLRDSLRRLRGSANLSRVISPGARPVTRNPQVVKR